MSIIARLHSYSRAVDIDVYHLLLGNVIEHSVAETLLVEWHTPPCKFAKALYLWYWWDCHCRHSELSPFVRRINEAIRHD